MSTIRHEMLNVDQHIHDIACVLNATSPGTPQFSEFPWQIAMRRLHGGLSEAVDVITLDNGRLRLQLLPTRGMGVWNGELDGVPLHWKSPVQRPVHPAFVDAMRRGGIGWLDGFNELICRCGLAWNGAPGTDVRLNPDGSVASEQFLPLHGRIANLPAHRVFASISEEKNGSLAVTGMVDESSMFGGRLQLESTLSTSPGSCRFQITDTVTNLSDSTAEVEMLYHCNIGEPFLMAGSQFHCAAAEVAPRDARAADGISSWNVCDGPSRGFAEQVYFLRPQPDAQGQAISVLCSPEADKAFCVRFDTSTLPYFALWKNTQSLADGYVVGLEPGSSFPNLRTIERKHGRVIQLPPGASVQFRISCEIALDQDHVRRLLDETNALQIRTPRTLHSSPLPEWCS